MDNEITVWNKVMGAALNMPGVQVNREEFLGKTLSNYVVSTKDMEKAIKTCPQMVIDKCVLSNIADKIIGSHLKRVSALSFASGLPGGWWIAATVPADLAQYYYHTLVVSQKLAYLYGIPSLCDERGELTDEAIDLMTVFVGVMSGVGAANNALKTVSQKFAEQIGKRLPKYALTKSFIYPVAKQVAKWLGVSLTKASFSKGVAKVIPILGGIISGSVTYFAFKRETKRLKKQLSENMDVYASAYKKQETSNGYA